MASAIRPAELVDGEYEHVRRIRVRLVKESFPDAITDNGHVYVFYRPEEAGMLAGYKHATVRKAVK